MLPGKMTLKAAGALLMVAAAFAPASALAGPTAGPLEYETVDGTAEPLQATEVVAQCATGQRVTGGGGSIAAPGVEGGPADTALTSIAPFDGADLGSTADDGYRAGGLNGDDQARPLRSVAICLEGGASLSYETNESSTSSSSFGQAVGCPGTKLLGGGAYTEGPHPAGSALTRSVAYDSDDSDSAADDGWDYGALRTAGVDSEIAAHAVCMPAGERPVRYRSSSEKVGPGKTGSLAASCPRRFHASGGGVMNDVRIRASLPFDGNDRGRAPDDGWKVKVFNPDDDPRTLSVQAICLR